MVLSPYRVPPDEMKIRLQWGAFWSASSRAKVTRKLCSSSCSGLPALLPGVELDAIWMTVRQPDNNGVKSAGELNVPATHLMFELCGLVVLRVRATTSLPDTARASESAVPMKPPPPSVRIVPFIRRFLGMWCCSARRNRPRCQSPEQPKRERFAQGGCFLRLTLAGGGWSRIVLVSRKSNPYFR